MKPERIDRFFLGGALILVLLPGVTASAGFRLKEDVAPAFQELRLKLDPRQSDFSGWTRIELEVKKATDAFQFHAEMMELEKVELKAGNQTYDVKYDTGERGLVTLRCDRTLPPGKYSLFIQFKNSFDTQASHLYRLQVEGEWYCFTDFEPDDARKAFPCWDEPIFKIPFQVTLEIPEVHSAVSNTPVAKVESAGGWKTIAFQKTKPLPSYLLAWATGALDFVDMPGMSIPGRVVTVKGKTAMAAEAIRVTPPVLAALEKYFGQKYPYEKIDFIAVPEFWAGAMENPGAITYRENLLLLEPSGAPVSQKRWLASTMAHELAHMWFGDLVTPEWWDDTWLNEAFASWMGDKITAEVFPEFKMENTVVNSTHSAMHTDALTTTKQVRRKVLPGDNIHAAFDNLAYGKGQAVLGMFENWIGAEKFHQGVLNYIEENKWGNANAADFWRALSQVSGYNIEQVMAPYLDKPGVPLVTAELVGNSQVKLTQRRFTNYGGEVDQSPVWQIPVVIKYSDGGKINRHPVLLTEKSMTFQLLADGKIEWIYPNSNCIGYYRWNLPSDMMLKLAGQAQEILEPDERMGLLNNLSALLDGGMVTGDQYLRVLKTFANDPDADVVSVLVNGIGKVKSAFITPELQDSFAAYIRETLRPAMRRFGFLKKKNEVEVVSVFRPKLLDWLAEEGNDPEAMKFAVENARKYMSDPASVDPSLASTVLRLSALKGDRGLFQIYRQRFESTRNPAERPRFLNALGNFRDPELIKDALEYVLTGPIRPHEILAIPSGIRGDKRFEDLVFEWMLEHYDAVTSKMPPSAAASMPFIAMGCSRERLEKAKEFFSDPSHRVTGTEEQMEKVSSYVLDCVNLREREGASVARYLNELARAD